MRQRVPDEATCPICGRHFDPSDTRGWCPNPSCGEWQHPSFPIDSTAQEVEETSESVPTKACPNCDNEIRADASFCTNCATQLGQDDEPEEEEDTDDSGVNECPDCGADLSQIPEDQLSTCPICMFDLAPVLDEMGGSGGDDGDSESFEDCPNCGEDLSPIPSDMRTVCPGCRVDLEEFEGEDAKEPAPADASGYDPDGQSGGYGGAGQGGGGGYQESAQNTGAGGSQEPAHGGSGGYQEPAGGTGGYGDSTQNAGAGGAGGYQEPAGGGQASASSPIDTMDSISAGYLRRLTDAGIETVGDLVRSDPDDISAKTGIAARRITDWKQNAPVSSDDVATGGATGSGTGATGQSRSEPASRTGQSQPDTTSSSSPDDTQETRIQPPTQTPTSKELVLEVMGQEIPVSDGSTVGREVRKAMVKAGAPEEDAVYVHRKHIRIDDQNGTYVLTRLGENSLKVNDQTVDKGNQVAIQNGDRVSFSDVVTATVVVR